MQLLVLPKRRVEFLYLESSCCNCAIIISIILFPVSGKHNSGVGVAWKVRNGNVDSNLMIIIIIIGWPTGSQLSKVTISEAAASVLKLMIIIEHYY